MTEEEKKLAILYNGLFQAEIDGFNKLSEEQKKENFQKAKEKIKSFQNQKEVEDLGEEFLATIFSMIYFDDIEQLDEDSIEGLYNNRRLYFINQAKEFFEKPNSEKIYKKYGIIELDEYGDFSQNDENISLILEDEGFQIDLEQNQNAKKELLNVWKDKNIFPDEKYLNEQSQARNGIGFKEFLFCEEYLKQGKITTTAKNMGIGRTTCYEYLKKKEVQDYLQERREEIRKESDSLLQTGFFKCFEELHNIIEKQYNSDCDRIKAIDCYLRHYEQAIYKQNEISQ